MCDELKRHRPDIMVLGEGKALAVMADDPMGVWCHIQDVRDILDEKDKEIALLKERICNGDVSRLTWIDDCIAKDKEIAELKRKLESVQASMYCDVVDANMENRRLRRALYKACANWADVVAFEETEGIGHDNSVAERWRKMERKCLNKMEEYK